MTPPRALDLAALTPADTPRLAAAVAGARLVCFPTDTVYGVGGPLAPGVREAIVTAKGRAADKPLQIVYPSAAALEEAVRPGPRLRDALRRLLPGPFTLVVPYPAGMDFPPPGPDRTLGVRAPAWPPAARALARLPFALLASSANPSGSPAPRSIDEVDDHVLAACDLVLDAGPVSGTASTVLDLHIYESDGRWRILRPGVVSEEGVAARLGAALEEERGPS